YLMARGPGNLRQDNDDDPERRGSTDSRLVFTAPADGDVDIYVTTYAKGESGAYSLTLDEGGARPGPAVQAAAEGEIRVGETRDGQLGPGSRQLTSGEYVAAFTLEGQQGQQLDLSMTSREFDPYLQIEGPDGFTAFNDD